MKDNEGKKDLEGNAGVPGEEMPPVSGENAPDLGQGDMQADPADIGATDSEFGEDAEDLKEEYSTEEQGDQSQLSRFKSLVSSDPKKSIMIVLALVGIMGGIMYYFLYSGSSNAPKTTKNTILAQKKKAKKADISTPQIDSSNSFAPSYDVAIDPEKAKASIEKLSAADKEKAKEMSKEPKVTKVTKPASPPSPKVVAQPNFNKVVDAKSEKPDIKTESAAKTKESATARLKSAMIIGGGGGGKGAKATTAASSRGSSSNYTPEDSAAPVSKLTKIGQMSSIITQGKILEAILETPVNTNYPGPIRAVLSRDVYPEQGERVLIPKGSRVIGELAGGYQAGQTRIMIKWDRIILPSGYDIKVPDAPGVSKLGSIGVEGHVERQLWNTLGNATLLSAINIGMAKLMETEFKVGSSTTTSTVASDGTQSTNSTASPTQQASQDALTSNSSSIKKWISDNFTSKPFIEIYQGTVVKIFVNSDIQFPQNITTGVDILE